MFSKKPRSVVDILASFTDIAEELDARVKKDAEDIATTDAEISKLEDKRADLLVSQDRAGAVRAKILSLIS